MEDLGPEHFFPGISWYEKSCLESGLEWLLPKEEISSPMKRRNPSCYDQNPVSNQGLEDEFRYQKPKYPDDVQLQVVPKPIEKGNTFDVITLLSSNHKDEDGSTSECKYLVRSTSNEHQHDEDRVEIEILRGKFIMLCCFFVPAHREGPNLGNLQAISLASHELSRKHGSEFKMVLVVKMREPWVHDKAAFDHFVSAFSCLVIPFDHPFRRDYICKSLNFEGVYKGLLVDPDQIVVQDNVSFLKWCGVYAFPFTDERLSFYDRESWRGNSLEQLLGCNSSDYLYKNCTEPGDVQPEKVSISELKGKLVGLYLCVTGSDIPMLEHAHKHSKDREHGFEIVLVYIPFYEGTPPEVFQEVINSVLEKQKISWWVLPFRYSVSCRLSTLANHCISDQLVIVSPHGELVDPCGGLVIENFGINAYPFTREGRVKAAFQTLERHSLESLLEGGFLSRRNSNADTNISVAYLQGRNILLYLASAKCLSCHRLVTDEVYGEIKAKNPDFEVVYVCLDNLDNQNLPPMPWLVFRPHPSKSKVFDKLFFCNFRTEKLVAFDKDGRICSINAQLLLSSDGAGAFPFAGDLLREIFSELDAGCGGRFKFDMVWSYSFMMDKRMLTSPYGANMWSSSSEAYKTWPTRTKRVKHVNCKPPNQLQLLRKPSR